MSHFKHALNDLISEQQDSIQSYQIGEQKVWLKKAAPRHSTWIYLPLKWAARLFGVKALTPIPNYGGEQAIQCEIERIQTLKQLGISTPDILAVNRHGVLLADAALWGETTLQFHHALGRLKDQPEAMLDLYQAGLDAISQVHQQKSYLSEAFARNILVDRHFQFTFIDFETDPGQVLDLSSCQLRDWLCLIFSTANLFEGELLQQASQRLLAAVLPNTAVYLGLLSISDKLSWLSKLNVAKLGSDGKRMQHCFLFMKMLHLEKPLPMI